LPFAKLRDRIGGEVAFQQAVLAVIAAEIGEVEIRRHG
jgi:hypothetical protein